MVSENSSGKYCMTGSLSRCSPLGYLMSARPSDLPAIFSEDNSVGAFIPAATFGFLSVSQSHPIFFICFCYLTVAGVHRYIIKKRSDGREDYSLIGKIILGFPLFFSYPLGLGFLVGYIVLSAPEAVSLGKRTIAVTFIFLNLSFICGMFFIALTSEE